MVYRTAVKKLGLFTLSQKQCEYLQVNEATYSSADTITVTTERPRMTDIPRQRSTKPLVANSNSAHVKHVLALTG